MQQATPLEQTETPAGPVGPTAPSERIQVLDVLRGFALLGILLVNMAMFINPVYYVMVERPPSGGLDAAVEWFIRFAAEGKFFPLFSFLFGLGFTIIMTRAQARGVRFVPLQMRRLLVLLVFGLVHALLIWVGDMLTYYALFGMLLLLFRNVSPKWLLRWSVIFLLLPFLFTLLGTVSLEMGRATPEGAAMIDQIMAEQAANYAELTARAYEVYATGNFLEITAQRWNDALFMWLISLFLAPSIFAMFLLGAYFGKREIFRHLDEHRPLFRRLLIWGGILGVIGNVLYATLIYSGNRNMPDINILIATAGNTFGGPALMLFYVASITFLTQSATWGPRLAILAPVGRMALTNYLLQSIICTLIFYGYGLGLFGQVGATVGLLLTLVIYAAQIPFSHWWMRRYRFGPAEWLWRTLTYGKPQPMRATS
jgi:uncharacterized protein